MKLRGVEEADERSRWKEFGAWLAAERHSQGQTRADTARAADLHPSTLATLENGGRNYRGRWEYPSPSDVTLIRLADAIGVDPFEVFRRLGRDHAGELARQTRRLRADVAGVGAATRAYGRLVEADRPEIARLRAEVAALQQEYDELKADVQEVLAIVRRLDSASGENEAPTQGR